jgi:hypothetical protein
MSHTVGMIIESLVAVLLVLTIGFCALLNMRLKRLKADEQSLKATIGELITATEIAERAIGGLKHTVRDCDENLGSRLAMAGEMVERLQKQLAEGDEIMHRLARIATAARPSAEQPASKAAETAPAARTAAVKTPTAKAIAAAAEAFAERRRLNGLAA